MRKPTLARALVAVIAVAFTAQVAPPVSLAKSDQDTAAGATATHRIVAKESGSGHSGRTKGLHVRGHVTADGLRQGTQPVATSVRPAPNEAGRLSAPASTSAAPPTDLAVTGAIPLPETWAIGGATSGSGGYPTTPMVAVGPDHVAQSYEINWLRITDRDGEAPLTIAYRSLFALPDELLNADPRIYYDVAHGRWVALEISWSCADNLAFLDIAVSDGGNPRKGWALYAIGYQGAIPREPAFGNASDKFVITNGYQPMAYACNGGGSRPGGTGYEGGAEATAFQWSDALNGGGLDGAYFDLPSETYFLFPIAPAIQAPATDSRLYIVGAASNMNPAPATVTYMTIAGVGAASTLSIADLTTGNVVAARAPYESGPWTAVWHRGRLVMPFDRSGTLTAEPDSVRIVDLVTNGTAATRRQDFRITKSERDLTSAGVGFSETGDLVIVYRDYDATTYVGGSAYVWQRETDPANTISAAADLITSPDAGTYMGVGSNVVGLAADPLVSDAVWVTHMAPTGDFEFTTQITQLRSATGDTYKPISPLRILDTRDGTGGLAGPFQNGVPRTFAVAGTGGGTIPTNAVAITGNVTVAGQTSAGFVSVGPSIGSNPSTSTINFPQGDSRANNLTLPLNGQGKLMAVFRGGAGKSSHLIVDVTGYFLADNTGATYKPVTSARLLDTRTTNGGLPGPFKTGIPRTFQVTGRGGIPAGAKAVTGNLTVVGQTVGGYVSLTPTPTADPKTSTLNFPVGDIRANGVTVPLSATGTLSATYKSSIAGSTHLLFDVTGYYIGGTTGLRFYPLNPGRIMDTRSTNLTQLSGMFTNSVPRTLVTGSHFGVPFDAVAVTGNLTVAGQTYSGYVSITKTPAANPTVSTINFPFGDIRANGVTVPLNASNDMALVYKSGKAGAKTHLILDLTGYFR